MDQITKLFAVLGPHAKLILGVIAVLIVATVGSLLAALRSSQKKVSGLNLKASMADAASAAGLSKVPIPAEVWKPFQKAGRQTLQLRQSFATALEMLKARVAGRNYRYQIPWFILMGETASGKTTMMDNARLNMPFGRPGGDPFGIRQACNWWLFDHGIVLDINGEYVLTEDGKGSDDSAWRTFLRLLLKNRNERPIDGVILAIPASDLVGSKRLSPESLSKKADILYEKIWTTQKMLGITAPIYIMVTKCDQVPGFTSFARGLPERLQDDIFGWSNPYSLQLAYLPQWIDEAFDSIQDDLRRTQVEIFAEKPDVDDPDGLFLFPSELQTIREPLRVYLNHIFKDSVYHEEFYFRGLYFTGDADATNVAPTDENPEQHARSRRPIFLKNLLEKKVFPEFRLARPVNATLLSKNRYVRIAQVASAFVLIVGGLGLLFADRGLHADIATVVPVLQNLSRDLAEINSLESKLQQQGAKDMKPLEDAEAVSAKDLLAGMEGIQATTMKTIFIPESWFSPIDQNIADSLSLAFDKIILNAIQLDLNQRLVNLLTVEPVDPLPAQRQPVAFTETPGFTRFQKFVSDMTELDGRIDDYNSVARPGGNDLHAVGRLVKYLFNIDVSAGFYSNSKFYDEALASSRHDEIDRASDKNRGLVARKLVELSERYRQAFEAGIPEPDFDDLITKVNLLALDRTGANSNVQPYQDMIQSVDKLQSVILRPELAFLEKPKFEPPPEVLKVLDAIQQSQLMGPDVRRQIERLGSETFDEMRAKLYGYQTELTGPILDTSQTELKLAPSVLALRKATEDFLNQRFMAAQTSKRIRSDLPPKTMLTWDPKLLEDALKLTEPYNAFAASGMSTFPEQLRAKLHVMALNRLEANMVDAISRAESLQRVATGAPAEAELQDQAKHFRDSAKPIDQLLNAFDQMELTRSYEDLSSLEMAEAIRLLTAVDQLAREKGLYSYDSASLAAWDGDTPISQVTFGAPDAKALLPYLDAQRENIKRLARDLAEPPIAFLKARPGVRRSRADEQLFEKWSGILTELDKYDSKVPANNIAVLESFISTDMPALTTENYAEKITPVNLTEHSDDFFLNTRNELRHALYDRYRVVSSLQATRFYTEMETYFNQHLASRFPFTVNADRIDAEADPEAIRGFFKLFDAHAKIVEKYMEGSGGSLQRVPLQFLDTMESVRSFFAPFLADGKSLAPVFDFEVEFRVNRRHEVGGNQIIDWSFEVGDQKITSRDVQKRGRWNAGDPVRVIMRWAKDGDIDPVPPEGPNIRVEEKTVTIEYTNRWSVLALIKQHLGVAADFDQLVDQNPSTLKFIVPTMQNGGTANTGTPAQTKVYVRLSLLSADKKDPISLPVFPALAPVWNRTGTANQN